MEINESFEDTVFIPPVTQQQTKRTRRPWVYKSEYDKLQRAHTIVRWLALIGWVAFSITLKIAL